jgi:hypothetical protein
VNPTEALAETRCAYAERVARQTEIDEITAQVAVHLI